MSTITSAPSSSDLYTDTLVWDAHAGAFPDPKVDLTLLNDWRSLTLRPTHSLVHLE